MDVSPKRATVRANSAKKSIQQEHSYALSLQQIQKIQTPFKTDSFKYSIQHEHSYAVSSFHQIQKIQTQHGAVNQGLKYQVVGIGFVLF